MAPRSVDSSTTDTAENVEPPRPSFPSELLYEIIAHVVAEYVDHAIAGVMDDPCNLEIVKDSQTPEEEAQNPIVPLFLVSYQFRETTRKVLRDAFDLGSLADGR